LPLGACMFGAIELQKSDRRANYGLPRGLNHSSDGLCL
jgi:hypothetical protein